MIAIILGTRQEIVMISPVIRKCERFVGWNENKINGDKNESILGRRGGFNR
jgi:hypothetical protein